MKSKLKKKTKHQDIIFPHHHLTHLDIDKVVKEN